MTVILSVLLLSLVAATVTFSSVPQLSKSGNSVSVILTSDKNSQD